MNNQPAPVAHSSGPNSNGRTAFARALQQSEARRLQVVLGVLAILLVLATLRFLFGGIAMNSLAYPARLIVLTAAAIYAVIIMRVVQHAEKRDQLLPPAFWIATAVFESTIPTLNIITLIKYAPIEPVDSVAAPAMIVYFLFSILSVLRLRPGLCVLSSGLSGIQHATLVLWTLRESAGPVSLYAYYLSYSVLILTGGACAAVVSREIRRHVHAGLREAYTRAELAEVRKSLEIARNIQQSLLPQFRPEIHGFDIAGWNRPADQTGGDYYDWQPLPDGRLAISVADVTGHGIGPALVTAVCRAYSRASFPDSQSVAGVMDRINDLLVGDLRDGRFVTFVVALLNPTDGKVELASAGHGPLLVYRTSGDVVDSVDAQGLPFGIAAGLGYEQPHTVDLAAGDSLILLTDGFFEWPNDSGELYGLERTERAIRMHATLPAREMIVKLYEDVVEFANGAAQLDDLTAVVIRRSETSKSSDS